MWLRAFATIDMFILSTGDDSTPTSVFPVLQNNLHRIYRNEQQARILILEGCMLPLSYARIEMEMEIAVAKHMLIRQLGRPDLLCILSYTNFSSPLP